MHVRGGSNNVVTASDGAEHDPGWFVNQAQSTNGTSSDGSGKRPSVATVFEKAPFKGYQKKSGAISQWQFSSQLRGISQLSDRILPSSPIPPIS
jgi:hypothetical protein